MIFCEKIQNRQIMVHSAPTIGTEKQIKKAICPCSRNVVKKPSQMARLGTESLISAHTQSTYECVVRPNDDKKCFPHGDWLQWCHLRVPCWSILLLFYSIWRIILNGIEKFIFCKLFEKWNLIWMRIMEIISTES